MAKDRKDNLSPRIANRKAFHDYHITEKIEVGIILQGSEIKSIRNSQVSLSEGFARIEPGTMDLMLYDVNIAPYSHAPGKAGHEPTRPRKLLAHKRQIAKLLDQTATKGVTLIPLAIYFVRGFAKLELGVGEGKKHYDKRQSIKTREAKKEMNRAMTRKRI